MTKAFRGFFSLSPPENPFPFEQFFSSHHFPPQSPDGRKFRSRHELRAYLEKTNSDHHIDEFDFSIWGNNSHMSGGRGGGGGSGHTGTGKKTKKQREKEQREREQQEKEQEANERKKATPSPQASSLHSLSSAAPQPPDAAAGSGGGGGGGPPPQQQQQQPPPPPHGQPPMMPMYGGSPFHMQGQQHGCQEHTTFH